MAGLRNIDLRHHLPSTTFIILTLLILSGLGGIAIYLGVYNIAADAPHYRFTYWLIENLRDQSIATRARSIAVPRDLADPKRVSAGAGLYTEMCSGCHLAPGMEKTEISQGLYPQAPELARVSDHTPAQEFWIIKHGVKLTAMPAWGKTHDDKLIWDMVAFVQQLPKLSPAQYQAVIKSAPQDHDAMMMNEMEGTPKKPHDDAHPDSHHEGTH
ncbi:MULTISPECIES: c-type cytochrome [Novosphingobium]|uniref:Cytochrome c n=1 Tax=Novosphingobium mangrovi (ex Huang et al. 2023) TaxID=2976432 RepID=A0ABT2I7V3_9SPHN|nr:MULTISPECIES: cytochrome c [Novosphingobium]MCT2400907.1 cytochrome c [Novosphingobium mangrovi (ex Huang et al. 2023)]CCA93211.1 cytochrome c family protein [Novosphingobium sp. PP1Y]